MCCHFCIKTSICNNCKPSKRNFDHSRQLFQSNSINISTSALIDKKRCLPNRKCPIGQEVLCIINLELKILRNPWIIQILCNCFFYHSIVAIATLPLDCVYATLKTQSVILSNLFKVKYYVISQRYVLSL